MQLTAFKTAKIPQVIQRLQPYEFRQKSIYNYALLEELLSSESESEKRNLWNVLDNRKQEELMFMYLDMLDDKNLSSCFSDLGGDYVNFIDRSSRHKVELKYSDNNWRLAQRLKELDYITSFSEGKSARKGKNADHDCKVIQCWIKAEE